MSQKHSQTVIFALILLLGALPAYGKTHSTSPRKPVLGVPTQPLPTPPAGAAVQSDTGPADGVAAIVNDAIITEYDLRQRILLFVSTSGVQLSPEILAKLRIQILTQLETEQLQIQEEIGRAHV